MCVLYVYMCMRVWVCLCIIVGIGHSIVDCLTELFWRWSDIIKHPQGKIKIFKISTLLNVINVLTPYIV